ncbi:hypothetical protein JD844_001637 [Phrynosoma platyrhinos]|uniref:Interleukin-27 subunit alpha n=1 Tax=Phrynosoma platyrhinos TaxID=52577 RepID=A0ABQ7TA26_PHRPL|nr:hypothetical protein JD844_001637 [Phrynosoma platyrhinos]
MVPLPWKERSSPFTTLGISLKNGWNIGTALLLQILFNVDFLVTAVPAGLHGEKSSSLRSTPEWRANLQKELGSSLKLSQQLLRKTRNLKCLYVSEHLSGVRLTLTAHSRLLPASNLDLHTWSRRCLLKETKNKTLTELLWSLFPQDAERLSYIAEKLSFYQTLVQQLKELTKDDSRFASQFEDLSYNLRDLSHQVSYQISLWELPLENQLQPTLKPPQILQHQNQWLNHQEVYLILHYLENFLCRVARDFKILRVRVAKETFLSKDPRTPKSHSFSS